MYVFVCCVCCPDWARPVVLKRGRGGRGRAGPTAWCLEPKCCFCSSSAVNVRTDVAYSTPASAGLLPFRLLPDVQSKSPLGPPKQTVLSINTHVPSLRTPTTEPIHNLDRTPSTSQVVNVGSLECWLAVSLAAAVASRSRDPLSNPSTQRALQYIE